MSPLTDPLPKPKKETFLGGGEGGLLNPKIIALKNTKTTL